MNLMLYLDVINNTKTLKQIKKKSKGFINTRDKNI